MKSSTLINIEIPDENRINNLVDVYSLDNKDELCEAFGKIKKRLGHERHDHAIELVQEGKFAEAVRLALKYYDKSYLHLLDKNKAPKIIHLKFNLGDPEKIGKELINFRKNKLND